MAFSASGLFFKAWADILDATGLDVKFTATDHGIALFTNSATPDYTSGGQAAIGDLTNEVSGGNYVRKTTNLTPTFAQGADSTILKYSHDAVAWTTASFTAKGAVWFADALSDQVLFGLAFSQDYTATNGTFTMTVHANGWFTLDLS